MTETMMIPYDKIETGDRRTQMRANGTDKTVVREYEDALSGNPMALPPIEVYTDNHERYWVVDGWHRLEAHAACDHVSIPATITEGSFDDALLASVKANARHGLRRSNDDKRLAVRTLLMHPEWGQWSSRSLAEQAGVSKTFVENMRQELQPEPESTGNGCQLRKGKDGKERKVSSKPTQPVVKPKQPTRKPEPQEPEIQVEPKHDPNGLELGRFEEEWTTAQVLLRDLHAKVQAVDKYLRDIDPGHAPWLDVKALCSDLDTAARRIRDARPKCVCPVCKDKPEDLPSEHLMSNGTCYLCGGRGYLSEGAWRMLPTADRKLYEGGVW